MADPLLSRAQIARATGTSSTNVRLRMEKAKIPPEPGTKPLAYRLSRILPEWQEPCRLWLAANPQHGTAQGDPAAAAATRVAVRTTKAEAVIAAKLFFYNLCLMARRPGEVKGDCAKRVAADYNARKIEVPEDVRAELPSASPATFWRINKAVAEGAIDNLADQRGRPRGGGLIDGDEAIRDIVVWHIEKSPHFNAEHVMDALQARFADDPGRRLPALATVQRYMARWRADHRRELSLLHHGDKHKGLYRPAFGSLSDGIERLNQVWEIDGTIGDVMTTRGRRTFIGIIDRYSRRKIMHVAASSSAAEVMVALFKAICLFGYPEVLRTDLGSDYMSKRHIRVLYDLGIAHDPCDGDSPEQKPFVERSFGTLTRNFLATLQGFVGHSVADAQALRGRLTKTERRGKTDAEIFGVELDPDELQRKIDDHLRHDYEMTPHSGLPGRVTPAQRALGAPRRRGDVEDPEALALVMAEPVPDTGKGVGIRLVGKNGVNADGGIYMTAAMGDWLNLPVFVTRHPTDRGRVFVRNEKTGDIVIAFDHAVLGLPRRDDAVQAVQIARRADSAIKAQHREREKRAGMDRRNDEVAAHKAEQARRVVPLFQGIHRPDDPPAVAAMAHIARELAREPAAPLPSEIDQEELAFYRRRNAELAEQEAARRQAELDEEEELRREAREAIEASSNKGEF